MQSFHSSNYTPVVVTFDVSPPSPLPAGSFLIAPRGTAVAQAGALIVDPAGQLIWDGSVYGQTLAFSAQTYLGQPVIAIWGGKFNAGGYGQGHDVILDQTYSVIANVTTSLDGEFLDFHEFQITDNNTALATIYSTSQYDLSSFGVQASDNTTGWILSGLFQEIDIATGQTLFTWSSLDHVNPNMSFAAPGGTGDAEDNPWDCFHINSIEKDDSGNYLVSSRHAHAVYYVSGANGNILWTINGMNSSFQMGNGSTFEWQHDARWVKNGTQISLFDNAGTAWTASESTARGLLLNIDTTAMSVTLAQEYLPFNRTPSDSQGSVRLQEDGSVICGWGQNPYYSGYDSNGTLIWSANLGVGDIQNYRAIRSEWTGYPTTNPNISVISNASTSAYDVYVSWNGATEVSTWSILGANDTNGSTDSLSNVTKSGFETYASIPQTNLAGYSWLQIRALTSNNTVLGYSDYMALNGNSTVAAAAAQTSTLTQPSGSSATSSTSSSSAAAATIGVKASAAASRYGSGLEAQALWGVFVWALMLWRLL